MKKIIIKDDYKKESKRWMIITLITYILSIIWPVAMKITNKGSDLGKFELFISFAFFFIVGSFSLYSYLYTMKYKLEISEKSIKIQTLFKKTEITTDEIIKYEYKKYKKSVFYKFTLICDENNYVFFTRYREDVVDLLNENVKK